MKKKLFLTGILSMVLVFGFLLSGCASAPPEPIVGLNPFLGTWETTISGMTRTLIFNADGTGKFATSKFTYKVDGNSAEVKMGGVVSSTSTAVLTGDSLIFGGATFKKK
jgi:hypothetical protein